MIELPKDFKEFLQLLNSKKVEYLIVGGYAVGYHGFPRATGDLDIWISVCEENAAKMIEVLKEFGFDVSQIQKDLFMHEGKIIRIGVPPIRLEILTAIDGVSFDKCFSRCLAVDFGSFTANIISKEDLLKNKRSTGRLKDFADYSILKEQNNEDSLPPGSVKTDEAILKKISEHPYMTIKEVSKAINLTYRETEKQIGNLKKKGRLRRVGPTKGEYWEVIRKENL